MPCLVRTVSEANTSTNSPLSVSGYTLNITGLPEGKYRLIALASQTDYQSQLLTNRAKFVRAEPAVGEPMEALQVQLDRIPASDHYDIPHASLPLDTLWHGMQMTPIEVTSTMPSYTTISLTRNTKKIRVTLREIDDPTTMDVDDYIFRIIDRNSRLAYDNTPDDTDVVVYTPHAAWNTDDRTAVAASSSRTEGVGRIAHADFMTSRIIYHPDAADDGLLTITHRNTGKECVRVNLPDILSRLRSAEENVRYSPQEFLDRGYDYGLDFYLMGGKLHHAYINISALSWAMRINFVDL